MKKIYLSLILLIVILFLLTSSFAQLKIGSLLLDNNFELIKNSYQPNNYYSNIIMVLTYLLEDNINKAWNYWKNAIILNPVSQWHEIIGLFGSNVWKKLSIYKELSALLKNITEMSPYLEYLYWKSLLSQNLIKEAEIFSDTKGFIKDFIFIGPFENVGNSGFYKEFPPEKEFSIDKIYKGKNGLDIKWFKPKAKNKNGYISLYNIIYPNQWSTAYALFYFFNPKNQDIHIRIGTSCSYELFINDHSIYKLETQREATWDQEIFRLTSLPKGWYKFLIKLSNQEGDFGFFLRITDNKGNKIPNSIVSTEPYNYQNKKLFYEKINSKRGLIRECDSSEIFYTFYGFLLGEYNYFEEAEEYLKRAEKIKPNSAVIKHLLGRLYLKSENIEFGKKYIAESYSIAKNVKTNTYFLALYELEYGRYEEALRYLEKEELSIESFLLRSLLIRLFNALSWTKEAETHIKILENIYPNSEETLFLRGKWYEKRNIPYKAIEYYSKALKLNSENWEIFYTLFYLAKNLHKYDIIEELSNLLIEKDPTDTWAYIQLADTYLSQERIEDSIKIIEKIKMNTFLYPEAFIYEAEIYNLKGEREQALELYEKALELDPTYKNIREYLNYKRSENIKIPDISEYLNSKIPEKFLDFPAVLLLDHKERIIYKDGSSSVIYHRLIKITKEEGKDKYGEIKIDYDSSFENVRILRARTIKPDGREIEATSIQDFSIAHDYPLYTDQRQIVISMPAIEKGAILECLYIVDEFSRGIFGKNFQDIFFFQSEIPTLYSRYILRLPKDINFKYKLYNIDINPKIFEEKEYKTYIWEEKNISGILEEPYMPNIYTLLPQLWISSFTDWESLAEWYYSLAYPQIRSDKNIKEKVKELTSGLKTTEEKIKAIYYFVTSQIRYVGLEYGIRGIMPHSASEIFKVRYGDCKDKAILLITMLKEIGIKAYYTLVSTRDSLPLKKELPGFQFDHAIVAIPFNNSYIFLDGTAEDTPFGELPGMDQGADAMIIVDGKPIFTKIPLSKPENNTRRIISNISLTKEKLLGETQIILTGYFATYYRWFLKSATLKQKEDILAQMLNNRIPNSRLVNWDLLNLTNLEEPLIIKITYENTSLLTNKDVNTLNMFLFSGLRTAEEIIKEDRNYPIEYYLPYEELEEINIKYDEKVFSIELSKNDTQRDSCWIYYEIKTSQKDNSILIKRNYKLKEIHIPIESYKEYKNLVEEIINTDKGILIIKKI